MKIYISRLFLHLPKIGFTNHKEEYSLTRVLESNNEGYIIAKIAGVKACEAISKQIGKDFISLMLSNLYRSCDNFDLESCYVLPDDPQIS
ncbi:NAD-dependent epimerase/dehydratase family protein [Algoriphagus boritolerans]|uniref:NAD-dependent epimerase/dehydratase family protein n=1 Tax=Algoriphagus boritolerans TaxID=308111 RepID=UPI002FCE5BC0